MIAAVLLALAASIDPCAPVEPAQRRDPTAAEAYLEVAEKEQRDGALDTAAAAYRSAWRANPESAKAISNPNRANTAPSIAPRPTIPFAGSRARRRSP